MITADRTMCMVMSLSPGHDRVSVTGRHAGRDRRPGMAFKLRSHNAAHDVVVSGMRIAREPDPPRRYAPQGVSRSAPSTRAMRSRIQRACDSRALTIVPTYLLGKNRNGTRAILGRHPGVRVPLRPKGLSA